MKNEALTKQEWQTPEIVDLDVKKTESGIFTSYTEATPFMPAES